jgi:hypothetical protein
MASDQPANSRFPSLGPLGRVGGRAAASALRPLTNVTVRAGLSLERHAVDRALDGGELERILTGAFDDARVQAMLRRALASDGARRLLDGFFDSGLFDHFMDRLLASDALWRLVDEIAQSPAVRAALSQQGLGFADQLGGAVRDRSRKADRRVEHTAIRMTRRRPNGAPPDADTQRP